MLRYCETLCRDSNRDEIGNLFMMEARLRQNMQLLPAWKILNINMQFSRENGGCAQKFAIFSETIFFHPIKQFGGTDRNYCNCKHGDFSGELYFMQQSRLYRIETKSYVQAQNYNVSLSKHADWTTLKDNSNAECLKKMQIQHKIFYRYNYACYHRCRRQNVEQCLSVSHYS